MAQFVDGEPSRTLEIRLLGSVRAFYRGEPLEIGPLLYRSLLAVLVLSPGQTLPRDTVIDALWGQDRPETASRLIADYLSRLRKALASAGDEIRLCAKRPGLCAELDRDLVDAHRFRDLVRRADRDQVAGDNESAAVWLRKALSLWPDRTVALADLESTWLRAEARRLDGWRLDALERLARLELDAGHPERAWALLRDIPRSLDRENLTAVMIHTLVGIGESSRAVDLADAAEQALGKRNKRPGTALRAALAAARSPRPGGPTRGLRQLPTNTSVFIGREEELRQLSALVARTRLEKVPGAVVISAIDGTGGVGKTTLAIHVGHRIADLFPDGQLFLDLRGFTQDAVPRDSGDALAILLRALDVTRLRSCCGPWTCRPSVSRRTWTRARRSTATAWPTQGR